MVFHLYLSAQLCLFNIASYPYLFIFKKKTFPAFLRYKQHITYKFEVYNVMIWYMNILQNNY